LRIGTKTRGGKDGITYIKTMPDGVTYHVEEVRNREKRLLAKTMYKKKGTTVAIAKIASEVKTSETTALQSTKIIPNPNLNVNENKLNQTAKGRIIFKGLNALIQLFKGRADRSTLLHESAHYFLRLIETFAEDGNIMAQQQLKDIKEWTAFVL
jgi:hypothetical protein